MEQQPPGGVPVSLMIDIALFSGKGTSVFISYKSLRHLSADIMHSFDLPEYGLKLLELLILLLIKILLLRPNQYIITTTTTTVAAATIARCLRGQSGSSAGHRSLALGFKTTRLPMSK